MPRFNGCFLHKKMVSNLLWQSQIKPLSDPNLIDKNGDRQQLQRLES